MTLSVAGRQASEANLAALTDLSVAWIDRVHGRRPPDGIILDTDSSESPTHGQQEGSAWNGHFGCTCYHPLFVFNQFGDLERCALRPSNVHSAEGWRSVLLPVIARYVSAACHFGSAATRRSPSPSSTSCWKLRQVLQRPRHRRAVDPRGQVRVALARLSCHAFCHNAVRLQLFALAYNLANFLRLLALPREVEHWSLTTLRQKLVKIGARIVRHGRYVVFQLAEVAVSRALFAEILRRIDRLRGSPVPAT